MVRARHKNLNMWWRRSPTREEIANIVATSVAEAMKDQRGDTTKALASTVENLFATQMQSFGKSTEAMTSFLGAIGDLAVRRAAVALGQRGGRANADRIRRAKSVQGRPNDCEVCRNPTSSDQASILRHVSERHGQTSKGAQTSFDEALARDTEISRGN